MGLSYSIRNIIGRRVFIKIPRTFLYTTENPKPKERGSIYIAILIITEINFFFCTAVKDRRDLNFPLNICMLALFSFESILNIFYLIIIAWNDRVCFSFRKQIFYETVFINVTSVLEPMYYYHPRNTTLLWIRSVITLPVLDGSSCNSIGHWRSL